MAAGWLTFAGCWIYCIANYGFLFGLGLGWLPAVILSGVVYLAVWFGWGLIVLAAAVLTLLILAA